MFAGRLPDAFILVESEKFMSVTLFSNVRFKSTGYWFDEKFIMKYMEELFVVRIGYVCCVVKLVMLSVPEFVESVKESPVAANAMETSNNKNNSSIVKLTVFDPIARFADNLDFEDI